MVISTKPLQPSNALSQMLTTDSGIVIDVGLSQLRNAPPQMTLQLLLISNLDISVELTANNA